MKMLNTAEFILDELFSNSSSVGEMSPTNADIFCNDNKKNWAERMEEGKRLADGTSSWLEATSDLQAFMDLTSVSEVSESADTDKLINEMEHFIQTYEKDDSTMDEQIDLPLDTSMFTKEETEAAEDMLNSLFMEAGIDDDMISADNVTVIETSEVVADDHTDVDTTEVVADDDIPKSKPINLDDSGFIDMSSVQQFVTKDGQNIIIMVAPPDVHCNVPSLKSSFESSDSDDADWTPDIAVGHKVKQGRPLVKRNNRSRKLPYKSLDKKERKKLQNVEAARRYRDKKKAEQHCVEADEQILDEKNKCLKSKVTELESEVKTMRKLMMELGILKTLVPLQIDNNI